MERKGFLLVMMQPPPALEGEFNEWYEREHLPERLAVPGFESARRYVAIEGWPRYLALYDLAAPQVLDTPDYRRVAGENFSPWTKRVLRSVEGNYRAAGVQLFPGSAASVDAARLLLLRFRGLEAGSEAELLAGLRANFFGRPETIQFRLLAAAGARGMDFLAVIEALAPYPGPGIELGPFGAAAQALDLVNRYVPYR